MHLLRTVWFERAACGLFALLAFASGFLPELFIVRHPDGSIAAAFVGVIVDPPTGESWDSTAYSPWPFFLLFAASAWYYFVRATRPNRQEFSDSLQRPMQDETFWENLNK
jgi:hypothetical protein